MVSFFLSLTLFCLSRLVFSSLFGAFFCPLSARLCLSVVPDLAVPSPLEQFVSLWLLHSPSSPCSPCSPFSHRPWPSFSLSFPSSPAPSSVLVFLWGTLDPNPSTLIPSLVVFVSPRSSSCRSPPSRPHLPECSPIAYLVRRSGGLRILPCRTTHVAAVIVTRRCRRPPKSRPSSHGQLWFCVGHRGHVVHSQELIRHR